MDVFEGVKGRFGFGCMRLPMAGEKVDLAETAKMVDEFLAAGFNYFDTAHGYLSGQSEPALKACLTSRYPRDRYFLTDKLSAAFFKSQEDIRPLFEAQLSTCGVEYFDYYLMHAQGSFNFPHFVKCRAYETAFELKKEGKIRHVGLSFHDRHEVLEEILDRYPEIELVQIQLNYMDYEDPIIQGKACLDVCSKRGKPVVVMEPIKGGTLMRLPEQAQNLLAQADLKPAHLAIRYAASFEGVRMVLSGMSDLEQMRDNLSYMTPDRFVPVSEEEKELAYRVADLVRACDFVACTGCRYCVDGCPKSISIPDVMRCINAKKQYRNWNAAYYYQASTQDKGKASDCIGCGACERVCPQKLPIRAHLKEAASLFEKK